MTVWRGWLVLGVVLLTGRPVFTSHVRPQDTPGDGFQQLLDRYRQGDADAAALAFSTWSDAKVDAAVTTIVAPDMSDPWTLAAISILHTEAGFRNDSFGRFRKGTPNFINLGSWGLENAFEAHSYTAYRLMDDVIARGKAQGDPRLLAVGRSWYIMAVSYCMRWQLDCAGGLFQKARHYFKDDAELLLLSGSAAEAFMTGGSQDFFGIQLGNSALGDTSTSHGIFGAERQEAEWSFRKALKLDPSLVEARVRLGRVLFLLDRNTEARAELEQAHKDARAQRHLFATYLSGLYLGELLEHEGDLSGAIPYYRDAVASYPRAHTAAVALGQALVRTGLGDAGWPAARAMFGDEGQGGTAVLDPWSIYRGAQYWQEASRLRGMRLAIRDLK